MLIPVLIVSSLVHCYSIGYMSSDPRCYVRGKRIYGGKTVKFRGTPKIPDTMHNMKILFSLSRVTSLGMIKFIVNPAGRDWFRPRGKFLALTSNLNNSCLTIFGVKKTYFDGENEMDNRGSKSTIFFNIFVKEQRVDGS